jgi:hypothetical protein
MSKAVRFDPKDVNWGNTRPQEEEVYVPTKDDVHGKRNHKNHSRDKNKKDKKFEDGYWN